MCTFVFMWTPALKTDEEEAAEAAGIELDESTSDHLGMIFAIFMVCVMIGSSLFKIATQSGVDFYKIPLYIHGMAFLNFLLVSLFIENKSVVLTMFLCFEGTVGVFYPPTGSSSQKRYPRTSVLR